MSEKTNKVSSLANTALNFTGVGALIKHRSAVKKYLTDKEFRKWVKEQDITDPIRHLAGFYVVAILAAVLIIYFTR